MKLLTVEQIIAIHDRVIDSNELQGMALDKSIDAILARVNNRITYGMISDVFELAACYIAVGHAFNDANKRTAYTVMDVCLYINGIELNADTEEIGNMIIQAAQSLINENDLSAWLRQHCE